MKFMKKYIVLTLLIIVSCKNEPKANKDLTEKIKMDSYLTVVLKGIVAENDTFEVFFSEFFTEQYYPLDKVQVNVEGKQDEQEIVFKLPEKIYPTKLRIDIGSRGNETSIKINEITLSTGTKKITFKDSELLEYFKPNKFINLDDSNHGYIRKSIDGIYDPYLISININDIVTNLFKENNVE